MIRYQHNGRLAGKLMVDKSQEKVPSDPLSPGLPPAAAAASADPSALRITQVTTPGRGRASFVFLSAPANTFASLPEKQNPTRCVGSLVARRGFEPRQTEPKSVVLPLYYRAIRMSLKRSAKIRSHPRCSKRFSCGIRYPTDGNRQGRQFGGTLFSPSRQQAPRPQTSSAQSSRAASNLK